VLKWLVLALLAYPITAFVVGADWGQVLRDTLISSMPRTRDEWATLVAILGTAISFYLFFRQTSEEVEEEKSAGQSTLAGRKGATVKELGQNQDTAGILGCVLIHPPALGADCVQMDGLCKRSVGFIEQQ
jgi:Mn2+/Fe2+ NRAMP family transporter